LFWLVCYCTYTKFIFPLFYFFIINQIYLEFLTRKEADEKTIIEIKFCLWFLPKNGNRRPNHWLTWNLPNRIGLVLQGACIMLRSVWDAQCTPLLNIYIFFNVVQFVVLKFLIFLLKILYIYIYIYIYIFLVF
jgi:hypothetical protein